MLTASVDCDTTEEVDCVTNSANSSTGQATPNWLTGTPVYLSTTFSKLNTTIFSPPLLLNTTTHLCCSAAGITTPIDHVYTLHFTLGLGLGPNSP